MLQLRRAYFGITVAVIAVLVVSAGVHSADKKKVQPKGNPAATPTAPGSKETRPYFWKKHESFVAVAKKGGADVVFFGDQMTEMWQTLRGMDAWETFRDLKAVNFAISSDLTQHLLWRVQNGELNGKPKVAVVMTGHANFMEERHSAEQVAEGVAAIVKAIQKKSPKTKVLLIGLPPIGLKLPNAENTKIIELNKLIAKLDDGKAVRYLDGYDRFLKDGQISVELMSDRKYLDKAGYQALADALVPVLKEMMTMD